MKRESEIKEARSALEKHKRESAQRYDKTVNDYEEKLINERNK